MGGKKRKGAEEKAKAARRRARLRLGSPRAGAVIVPKTKRPEKHKKPGDLTEGE